MCQLVRNHTISGVNEIYFRKPYSLCKSCTLDQQTLHISKIRCHEWGYRENEHQQEQGVNYTQSACPLSTII